MERELSKTKSKDSIQFLATLMTSFQPIGYRGVSTSQGDRPTKVDARRAVEGAMSRLHETMVSFKEKDWRPHISLPELSLPKVDFNRRVKQFQKDLATPVHNSAPKIDAERFVKDATSPNAGWTLKVERDDGIRVWRRTVFGSRASEIRGNGILEASPKDVDALMQCPDERIIRLYNPMYQSGYDLEKVDSETRISYGLARSIAPFKPRDTVTRVAHRKLKDGSTVLILHAVEHKKAPQEKGVVRAQIMRGMYLMQPIENQPTRTNFTFTQHIDVGAYVPSWLMNTIITKDAVNFVKRLSKTSRAWQSNKICANVIL